MRKVAPTIVIMDGRDRVIAAVIDRRSELDLTQKGLAKKAGVAERTVQNLEAGKRLQPIQRGKIERALGWKPGELRRIEGGGEADEPLLGPDSSKEIAEEYGPEGLAAVLRTLRDLRDRRQDG